MTLAVNVALYPNKTNLLYLGFRFNTQQATPDSLMAAICYNMHQSDGVL